AASVGRARRRRRRRPAGQPGRLPPAGSVASGGGRTADGRAEAAGAAEVGAQGHAQAGDAAEPATAAARSDDRRRRRPVDGDRAGAVVVDTGGARTDTEHTAADRDLVGADVYPVLARRWLVVSATAAGAVG